MVEAGCYGRSCDIEILMCDDTFLPPVHSIPAVGRAMWDSCGCSASMYWHAVGTAFILLASSPGPRGRGYLGKYDITTPEVSLLIRIPIAYISRILITGCTEQLDKSRAQTPFPNGIWARDYSRAWERGKFDVCVSCSEGCAAEGAVSTPPYLHARNNWRKDDRLVGSKSV